PGAASMVGTEMLAHAVADGYTIGFVSMSHTINPSIYKKLPFDPIADFAPVVLAATAPNVLVVNPAVGARSVAELVQVAKARRGASSHSRRPGSSAHRSRPTSRPWLSPVIRVSKRTPGMACWRLRKCPLHS